MEKTSIEKSHSASSNALLTLICVLAIVFLTAFSLVMIFRSLIVSNFSEPVFIGLAIATGVLTLISILLFNTFRR